MILIAGVVTAYGQENIFRSVENPNTIKELFEQRSQQIHSLQCNFKQSKYITYLSAFVDSEGKFYMKNKNKIRWEYTEPFQYKVIVVDGEVKLDNNNSEFKKRENKYFDYINRMLPEMLSGNFNSPEEFSTSISENDEEYLLSLVPEDQQVREIISQINLLFSKHNIILKSIRINEPTQDFTLITFYNYTINPVFSDDLF